MKNLLNFLKEFIANKGLLVFASTLFNKISFFLISVVAARMLFPDEYGKILLIVAIFNLITTISGLGSYQGLLRFGVLEKDEEDKNILSAYVFWKGLANHFIVTVLFFVLSCFYLLKYEHILYIIFFFVIRLMGYYFFNHIQIDYRIRSNNRMYALTGIYINFINLVLVTILTYFWKEIGFLIAMAVSPWFVFVVKKRTKLPRKIPRIDVRKFWNYSYNSTATYFLSDLLFMLDTFILAMYLDETSVAFYKTAVILPMNLNFLPLTFIQTDYPKLVKNFENKDYLKYYIKNYYKIFISVGLVILLLGYIFRSSIIPFVFGSQYLNEMTGNVFMIMLIAFVGNMWMRNLYVSLISAVGKAKWNTYTVVATLFLVIILMLILVPKYELKGAALSMAAAFTFSGLCSMIMFYRYLKTI